MIDYGKMRTAAERAHPWNLEVPSVTILALLEARDHLEILYTSALIEIEKMATAKRSLYERNVELTMDLERVIQKGPEMLNLINARIDGARLGFGGHPAFLDFSVDLDYGDGRHQSWGGVVLGHSDGRKESNPIAGDAIIALLRTVGVTNWGDLVGTPVQVLRGPGLVVGLGHYLEDKWVWFSNGGVHTGTLDEARAIMP